MFTGLKILGWRVKVFFNFSAHVLQSVKTRCPFTHTSEICKQQKDRFSFNIWHKFTEVPIYAETGGVVLIILNKINWRRKFKFLYHLSSMHLSPQISHPSSSSDSLDAHSPVTTPTLDLLSMSVFPGINESASVVVKFFDFINSFRRFFHFSLRPASFSSGTSTVDESSSPAGPEHWQLLKKLVN